MAAMYLEETNAGYGILVTDGCNWWYYDESILPVYLTRDIDRNQEIIKEAVKAGKMYTASEWVGYEDRDDYQIHSFTKKSIYEIAEMQRTGSSGDDPHYYEIMIGGKENGTES